MGFTEEQISSLAPNAAAFKVGKKLSAKSGWDTYARSPRAIWGTIRGSGKKPYMVRVDLTDIAFKCTCPSRQFPCKHAIGLMLLLANEEDSFISSPEPDWVQEWLDLRQARQEKKEAPKTQTPDDLERAQKNKLKTQANRLESVILGAKELELWLKDLVRIGLLDLPNREKAEFEKVAARMIDAKAPGLAGWVRKLAKLDYKKQDTWHEEALTVISKLYLLIQNIIHFDQLDFTWQQTVKNLAGWSQSSKELLANEAAETINDHWLVVGQDEESSEEIVTQRNWLIGLQSGKTALILNFSTKYSNFETPLLAGSTIEAELAFFPSVQPHRAVVKTQKNISNEIESHPNLMENWHSVHQSKLEQLKFNPWVNDMVFTLRQARLIEQDGAWMILDQDHQGLSLIPYFNIEKCLKWLVISGNKPVDFTCVMRDDKILPLGLFQNQTYTVL